MKRTGREFMTAAWLAVCSIWAVSAAGQVILNDTFSDNERFTQNLPFSAAWYFGGSGTGAGASASAGGLTISVGDPASSSVNTAYLTTSGSPLTLNAVGDKITLTFDLTLGTLGSTRASGIVFGLYNSGGNRVQYDSLAVNGAESGFNHWTGYAIYARTANVTDNATGLEARGRSGPATALLSTTGTELLGQAQVAANSIASDGVYLGNFITVTRTATGVNVSGKIGVNTIRFDDNTDAYYSFDAISIGSGHTAAFANGSSYTLDNVSVLFEEHRSVGLFLLTKNF